MKRILGILLTVTLLVALLVPVIQYLHIPVNAQELEVGQEVVELRTQSTKTHYIGDGIYSAEAALWPVHYQDEGWQEIDNAWVPATAPWNWEMVHDSYHAYALNQFTYGQILKFELGGESIAFQPMELQWTNDYSQIETISSPQNVLVEVTKGPTEVLSGMDSSIGSIKWDNAYGSGRHFEFTTTPGKLQTLLTLDAAPPEPAQYIIDGGSPVMRQSFIFAPSKDLDIYVNGSLWDKKTKVQTVNDIEFRLNGEPIWYFWQARYWDSGNSTGIASTILRKAGKSLWLDVLVPYEWLQNAVYPIFIDPDTGATYPGLGSTEDRDGKVAWVIPTNIQAEANCASCMVAVAGADYSDWLRASHFGFAVPSGAIIDGIKVEINHEGSSANKIKDSSLRLVNASGVNEWDDKASASYWPTDPTTATYGGASDLWGATLTPAIVNNDNFGVRLSAYSNTDFANAYVYWVKITIYYTPPPEAECQAASNIASTTARLNGIITDDKGHDCEARFRYGEVLQGDDFEWGEDGDRIDTNGGGITWTKSVAGTSTAKISTDQQVSGTRSLELYRDGSNNPYAYFPHTAGTGYSIRWWGRKGDTAQLFFMHGNGAKRIYLHHNTNEILYYNDGTAYEICSISADTWTLIQVKNINWDAGTFDVYCGETLEKSGATMQSSANTPNVVYFQNNAGTSYVYIDDVEVIEDWTVTEWQNTLVTDSEYYEDIASLDPVTDYVFQTQAREIVGDNEGLWSDSLYFTTCPTAPTNVAATDGDHTDKVVVNWTKSEGATGYKVYGDGELLDTLGDVATYDDTNAPAPTITAGSTIASDGSSTAHVSLELSGTSANNGTLRTYKVKAFNDSGDSPDSDTDTGYRGVGGLTYQWQRSSGDADEDYSNIDGATISTYNDTDAPAPTITPGSTVATDGDSTAHVSLSLDGTSTSEGTGRYYQCILNADGAAQQISGSNRGYRTVGELSYQWQRSAGNSDEDYSNIDGATSSTYDDTEAPAPTITSGNADAADGTSTEYVTLTLTGQQGNDGDGRYYQCVLNADGAVEQTSSSNRGHRGVDTLSLQWQRSAADSDADYSNIIGAVSTPYNDANGVAAPDGRYYQGIVSMSGAISQNSTSNRGYFLAIVPPTVVSYNATGITGVSGILHGEITLTGYENASTIGFEWGLTVGNYTYNWTDTGSFGLGTFDHEITDLLTNTTYFWRAFAINAGGRGNSTALNFTTLALPFLPTNFTATAIGTSAVNLTWTMGVAANITVIRYRESGYPTSPTEGLPAYSGNGTWTIIEGLNLDTTIYYFSAWSYNDFGYSIDYATAKIGGNMQAILMFGLLFLVAIGFIVLYLWKREMWLGIAAGTVWVATAIYAWVGYEAPTPAMTTMWFGLGWLFLAIGLALLVAPLSWNKTKDEIWEESMDPDTGEPIMEEYKNGNKTGQTRPLTDLEMTERQQPQEKRRRDKSSKFSREGRL